MNLGGVSVLIRRASFAASRHVSDLARQVHQLDWVRHDAWRRGDAVSGQVGRARDQGRNRQSLHRLGAGGPGSQPGAFPCLMPPSRLTSVRHQCVDGATRWAIHTMASLPFSVSGNVALMGDAVSLLPCPCSVGGPSLVLITITHTGARDRDPPRRRSRASHRGARPALTHPDAP